MWFPTLLRNMNTSGDVIRIRPPSRTSRAASRRTRLSLEALEDRCVPSAVAGLSSNTLTIIDPDTTGHTINVTETAVNGQFQVESPDSSIVSPSGTTLALPGNSVTFNGVANIAVGLGADSDNLNFNTTAATTSLSGRLNITAGDGNNSVNVALNAIGGNLSMTEGNGSDLLVMSTDVGGNVSVTQGNAFNDIVLIPSDVATVTIGGNLSVIQGGGSDNDVLIQVSALTISGNFSVTQGNGLGDQFDFITLAISGNFSVTQDGDAAGIAANFAFNDPTFSVAVGRNFSMTQAEGGFVAVYGLRIGGNLSLTQGPDDDNVEIDYSTIGGNISVTQGDGVFNSVEVDAAGVGPIVGNVSVTQGNGDNDVVYLDPGNVRGRLSVRQGDGIQDGVAVLGLVNVGGNLALTQGNGTGDQVYFDFNGAGADTVGGNLSLTQGDGTGNQVFFSPYGGGENTVGGKLSLTQGNGDTDLVDLDDTNVTGKTAIGLGNGASDEVDIEGGTDVADGLGVMFGGHVSINFGNSGTDKLSIGTDGDSLVFGAKAGFTAGSPGNIYVQGPFAGFPSRQPALRNL